MKAEVIDMKQAINEMMSDEYKKDESTHYNFYSGEDDGWIDSDEITIDDLVTERDNFIVKKKKNDK